MKVKEYCTTIRAYLRNIEFDLKQIKMNTKFKQDLIFYNNILSQLADIRKETGNIANIVTNLKRNAKENSNTNKITHSRSKSAKSTKKTDNLNKKIAKFEKELNRIKTE